MKKWPFFVALFFLVVTLIFFYPIFKGYIPFPGDNLVGNYKPYSTYTILGFAPGGYPNKAQNFDILKLLYPAKEFTIRMWQSGQVPLWNPYNFSGNPHLASLQAGSFYTFNSLFFIFPFLFAWSFYILLQPIIAGIFTYLFLRKLALGRYASLFGGACFSFSHFSLHGLSISCCSQL